MKKYIIILLLSLGVLFTSNIFLIRENYRIHNRIANIQDKDQKAIEYSLWKEKKLSKVISFRAHPFAFKYDINLLELKNEIDYYNGLCEIKSGFYLKLENELKNKKIIHPVILDLDGITDIDDLKNDSIKSKNGISLDYKNISYNICQFINKNKINGIINLDFKDEKIGKTYLDSLQELQLVGEYEIDKYSKTPENSILNSMLLLSKLSGYYIKPGEEISVLDTFLDKNGADMVKSNTLVKGEILQTEGGGACLGNTILYRALLNAGLDIIEKSNHNIYYKNIYGTNLIGLDATLYFDDYYRKDLIFRNSYSNDIFIISYLKDNKLGVKIYSKNKEFYSKLTPVDIKNKDTISWIYTLSDSNNKIIKESTLKTSYTEINNF